MDFSFIRGVDEPDPDEANGAAVPHEEQVTANIEKMETTYDFEKLKEKMKRLRTRIDKQLMIKARLIEALDFTQNNAAVKEALNESTVEDSSETEIVPLHCDSVGEENIPERSPLLDITVTHQRTQNNESSRISTINIADSSQSEDSSSQSAIVLE